MVGLEMIAGGLGCAFSNGSLNFFETTKVKLQLHNSARPVYREATMLGVLSQIIKEEGFVTGLMLPGLSASLIRSMIYGSYRVGLYPTIRDWISSRNGNGNNNNNQPTKPTIKDRMISGSITGAFGSALSCPLDCIRTRMQADAGLINKKTGVYSTGLRKGHRPQYNRGFINALATITKKEGIIQGLYRGSVVTVARATLLNCAQLASYDTLKHEIFFLDEGPALHITCSLTSGIIAQTVIMPFDTIKSHMMQGHSFRGTLKIATSSRRNPFFWFYKGYLPAATGQGMIMVLQMPLIEEIRRMMGLKAI